MASLLNMSGGVLLNDGLPNGAVEIEYLESNFSSNRPDINTGITATTSVVFEITCSFINLTSGRHGSFNTSPARFYFGVSNNKFIAGCNSSSFNHNISTADSNVHSFSLGNQGFYIDGVKKMNSGSVSSNSQINIFNAVNAPVTGRVYSSKIYNNEILVRDFIPVRIGQIGYLYDRVTKNFFGKNSSSANNFILGPDIN